MTYICNTYLLQLTIYYNFLIKWHNDVLLNSAFLFCYLLFFHIVIVDFKILYMPFPFSFDIPSFLMYHPLL